VTVVPEGSPGNVRSSVTCHVRTTISAVVSVSVVGRRERVKKLSNAAAGQTCESNGSCSGAGVSSSPGALKVLASASVTEYGEGSAVATATTTFSTVPTPSSSNAEVVDLDNSNITWFGNWTDVPSSCNSSAKSKFGGPAASMIYPWLGAGIYLSLSTWNATFTLLFNGIAEAYGNELDFVNTPANCSYIFYNTDLVQPGDGINELAVIVGDSSPGAWSFEVNSIIVLQNSTSSGASGGKSGSSGGSGGGSSKGTGGATTSFALGFSSSLWASVLFYVTLAVFLG